MKQINISTQPYRGTRDFYPEQQRLHDWIFKTMSKAVERFGYEKYNAPMLEPLDLYAAKSGPELVLEQAYNLTDKGGRQLTVRPEMTPSLARMVAARRNSLTFPLRWYSTPNLWRYENPQRGRAREHWQLNVDLIGVRGIEGELEILQAATSIMKALGADSSIFSINYSNRKFLNSYLAVEVELDEQQVYATTKIIDRKNKIKPEAFIAALEELNLNATQIKRVCDYFELSLSTISDRFKNSLSGADELVTLNDKLEARGISGCCQLNLGVVRGLDYYTGTVFEMYDLHPDNRRALFGGGRYDKLVGLFGGEDIPAVGFGLGDITITDFIMSHNLVPKLASGSSVLIVIPQEATRENCLQIAKTLRNAGIRTEVILDENLKMKKQLKYADVKNIPIVVMLGEDEIAQNKVTVKNLASHSQESIPKENLVDYIKTLLKE